MRRTRMRDSGDEEPERRRRMILVVDDDMVISEVLRKWLEGEGFDVTTCSDGQQAYDKLKEDGVECMILDINMPLINGVELLLLMQAEGIDVPTVVMAGFDDFDEKEMKQFGNVVRFFPKPFEMEEMVRTVKSVAEG